MRKTKRTPQKQNSTSYESLESRDMLTIVLGTFNGFDTVLVEGTGGNDLAVAAVAADGRLSFTLNSETEFFARADVERILFRGLNGDDQFTNNTDVSSFLYGHNGNDILRGGSGNNWIQGGGGNDRLFGGDRNDSIRGNNGDDQIDAAMRHDRVFGGDGDDLIIGSQGNDFINAGEGDDSVFAGTGGDRIIGGLGNDVLDGGDGDDVIFGQDGADEIFGRNGNDQINGGIGNDEVFGNGDDDILLGDDGNDLIDGGSQDDRIIGGTGNDTIRGGTGVDSAEGNAGNDSISLGGNAGDAAVYSGQFTDYLVSEQGSGLALEDLRTFEGNDVVTGAEFLDFSDGRRTAEAFDAAEVVTIQPIIVSNSDGSNTAEYFGNATQQAQIQRLVDEIFAVANIDVEWLAPREFNNTSVNLAQQSFDSIFTLGDSVGVGNSNPLVLDVYFTEIVPESPTTGENTVNGLAFVDVNGIVLHVGDNLVNFAGGREVVASVAAHEIAHNLGLFHVTNDPDNLLFSPGSGRTGDELTQSQINTIISSQFTVPV